MEGMGEPKNKEDTGARELQLNVGGIAGEGGARKTHYEYTLDGSVDIRGNPAKKGKSGGWLAGSLLLVNQGLATLAFFGVNVNLVLFLTRVLQQHNADAANNVSKWTGTVYIFSLVGAFLSDSYWGRYKTCAVFQVIFVLGLIMLSFSSQMFLVKPSGCGDHQNPCRVHSNLEIGAFYLSTYMVALGNGGYQPNVASFGADQFDVEDAGEAHSKISFFSYFYLALNLGSLFSNTVLSYLEDQGSWSLGFWASTLSAVVALLLFLSGTHRYRHFAPGGNPLARICQVAVAALRKWRAALPPGDGGAYLYEMDDGGKESGGGGCRKMLHTDGFRFLDRAAVVEFEDFAPSSPSAAAAAESPLRRDPWRLCPVTQVEEVKCVLRLLPIWLCTILYSVVFTQMASLFVVQGAAMHTAVGAFSIPPSSMSAFDILSVAAFIFLSRRLIDPVVRRVRSVRHHAAGGLTELQRMGIGLVVAVAAMVAAGAVEHVRLKRAAGAPAGSSSLHIMWQVPQYVLIGASEVFMYVGQLEFFNRQAPEGLKSFASALCMTSISFGNFFSDLIVSVLMEVTAGGGRQGWIPEDLNRGHLDRFYYMLAALTSIDFVVFVVCAKWYKSSKLVGKNEQPV